MSLSNTNKTHKFELYNQYMFSDHIMPVQSADPGFLKASLLLNSEFLSLKQKPIPGVKIIIAKVSTPDQAMTAATTLPIFKVEFDVPEYVEDESKIEKTEGSSEDWDTVDEDEESATLHTHLIKSRSCHAGHKIPMTITFTNQYPLSQPRIKFGQLRDYLDYGHCCFEKYLALDWPKFLFSNPEA